MVTGAPRYESKGAVIFGNKTQAKLLLEQIIHGEQVGSYFGNSLAVTDLNNDRCVSTPRECNCGEMNNDFFSHRFRIY